MNNDPTPYRRDDNIAATPLTNAAPRRFNPLWFLLLLLIPLLLLPFCHHRDTDHDHAVVADATPASGTPANLEPERPASTTAANPFTAVTTGNDAGKAVLNFDANATQPSAPAAGVLSSVIAYLQANPTAKVSLKGFTDSTGTAEQNRKLTQQRIDMVKSALTSAGIDAGRIETANFGEAYPVTDNANPQARELNRRVEVTLVH